VLLTDRSFSEGEIAADVRTPNREASLIAREQDAQNFYLAVLIPEGVAFHQDPLAGTSGRPALYLFKRINGEHRLLRSTFLPSGLTAPDRTVRLELAARGSSLRVSINGTLRLEVEDPTFSVSIRPTRRSRTLSSAPRRFEPLPGAV
jgi:hypothetical protein